MSGRISDRQDRRRDGDSKVKLNFHFEKRASGDSYKIRFICLKTHEFT